MMRDACDFVRSLHEFLVYTIVDVGLVAILIWQIRHVMSILREYPVGVRQRPDRSALADAGARLERRRKGNKHGRDRHRSPESDAD